MDSSYGAQIVLQNKKCANIIMEHFNNKIKKIKKIFYVLFFQIGAHTPLQSKDTKYSQSEPVWPSGKALSPFLIGRMFLREPSWKYSAKLFGS